MTKPYTPDIEQDELILAAIIAGGVASGREVRPALTVRPSEPGHRNYFGIMPENSPKGPCCAVGAGVLFTGQKKSKYPLDTFARRFGVNHDYAGGVSDGFEGDQQMYVEDDSRERGYAVGSAAYDFFHEAP